MADLNYCSFIGRLGKDPETRYMPNGDAISSFSIAVGEKWTDKASGEKKESTEWIRCVAWRKLGEICGEYLKKGAQVFVSGKMKTRKWEKDGVTHYSTEIAVGQMQMLGSKPQGEREHSGDDTGQTPAAAKPAAKRPVDDMEDDIPF